MPPSRADADLSNGWEALARDFIAQARSSRVGVVVVEFWTNRLPAASAFLDLGCGPGGPRSEALHLRGTVCAIDASPSLARAYQEHFPQAQVACEPVAGSTFFRRGFNGILAWGLLFLLPAIEQERVIRQAASSLASGGSFLFTAPWQVCSWSDNSTGRESVSLGRARYSDLLDAAGLMLANEYNDDGENHYYEATRR